MFRGCAPKCCLENNATFGEGIVQGVVKATQTGILWPQAQVLVGPPEKQGTYRTHALRPVPTTWFTFLPITSPIDICPLLGAINYL